MNEFLKPDPNLIEQKPLTGDTYVDIANDAREAANLIKDILDQDTNSDSDKPDLPTK